MAKTPGNRHNNFFRSVFRDPDTVRDFLLDVLPGPVLEALDLSVLETDPLSHVEPDLAARFSDLTIRLRRADSQEALVYILMEHKSLPDGGVLLQLLGYMLLMWREDRAAGRPLRIIIPLVFYHGERRWTVPLCFEEQFSLPEPLLPYLPRFRYLLFDARSWEEDAPGHEVIRANVFLLTSLLLFKHIRHLELEHIRKILAFWRKSGYINKNDKLFLELQYIVETTDIRPQDLGRMLEETLQDKEATMPTLAERWIEEGKLKGKAEGKAEGILQDKRQTLLRQLERREPLTPAERELIASCGSGDKLDRALDALFDGQPRAAVLGLVG